MDAIRHNFVQRMIGAAKADAAMYTEVEHDAAATPQAAGVVAIAAAASAIGGASAGAGGMAGAVIAALVGWLLWAGLTYLIGDKLLGGTATWGELLRAVGFAQAAGVLYVLAAIPGLGDAVKVVVGIWVLVCGVVAIREALDFSTGKAVLTAILGWVVAIVLATVLVDAA